VQGVALADIEQEMLRFHQQLHILLQSEQAGQEVQVMAQVDQAVVLQ
jgi:hypothetical protein